MGIEDDIKAQGTPSTLMGDTVFCTSLTGDEIGRVRTWGTHPARRADYTLASPSDNCDLPQTLLEPILIGHAAERGSRIRFDTEYLSLEQDADGVTVTVRDRLSGHTYPIRARYVIGADGGRSQVARDVGLPFEGQMDIAGSMNIVFHADLSKYVEHRPSVLYWVLQPGSNIGGIGMGLVRMVRPWDEWLVVWGYDIAQAPPEVDDAMATKIVHDLVGDDTVPVTIRSTSLWGNNKMYATRYRAGRVFCAGDAVHRHPPSNGLGSNTSIQDSYNLAWKLAAVLSGQGRRGPARQLRRRARPGRRADRPAGQQVHRAVRPDLRRARVHRLRGLGSPDREHAGPCRGHPGSRAAADRAARGAGAQGLRVQRARRGAGSALPVRRGGHRRHRRAGVRPRSRAVLPPDDLAGGPAPALLARRRRAPDQHPRHHRQGPVHRAHRHLGPSLGRGGRGCRARTRHRGRRPRDRAGPASTPTSTTTGRACARWTSPAACWSAPTRTWAGGRTSCPPTRRRSSPRRSPDCSAEGNRTMVTSFVHTSHPSRVVFGVGTLETVAAEVERLGRSRVLVLASARARRRRRPRGEGSRAARGRPVRRRRHAHARRRSPTPRSTSCARPAPTASSPSAAARPPGCRRPSPSAPAWTRSSSRPRTPAPRSRRSSARRPTVSRPPGRRRRSCPRRSSTTSSCRRACLPRSR